MICACSYLHRLKIIKTQNNTIIEKNKILVSSNRNVSRSQMTGINLIKIREALISFRVPLKTLPNNGKINISINNTNNTNNDNNNKSNNNNNK